MSKLTAMQELILKINKDLENIKGKENLRIKKSYLDILCIIDDFHLLEKEKQQIIEAWNHAELRTPIEMKHINNAHEYFIETFKTK